MRYQSFTATLVAPPSYGTGSIAFTASATERENDFDPASNTATSVSQLYNTFYVTTTSNDGSGSLRQAILDSNATCNASTHCAIGFRIEEPSANPWKTIHITTPLPALTSPNIRVDGGIQTGLLGDTNPDGPEVEISGGGVVDGDGLVISSCGAEIANLTINGFRRNGLSVTPARVRRVYAPPNCITCISARIQQAPRRGPMDNAASASPFRTA